MMKKQHFDNVLVCLWRIVNRLYWFNTGHISWLLTSKVDYIALAGFRSSKNEIASLQVSTSTNNAILQQNDHFQGASFKRVDWNTVHKNICTWCLQGSKTRSRAQNIHWAAKMKRTKRFLQIMTFCVINQKFDHASKIFRNWDTLKQHNDANMHVEDIAVVKKHSYAVDLKKCMNWEPKFSTLNAFVLLTSKILMVFDDSYVFYMHVCIIM